VPTFLIKEGRVLTEHRQATEYHLGTNGLQKPVIFFGNQSLKLQIQKARPVFFYKIAGLLQFCYRFFQYPLPKPPVLAGERQTRGFRFQEINLVHFTCFCVNCRKMASTEEERHFIEDVNYNTVQHFFDRTKTLNRKPWKHLPITGI